MGMIWKWRSIGPAMLLAFLIGSAPPACAADGSGPPPPSQPQQPAGKFVQDLGDQAVTVISDKSLPEDQRTQKYRSILRASFDMQTIGHFVLGRAWNTAAPEKQKKFMDLFEQWVLKIYGDRLSFYRGEGFQVKNVRQESDKDFVVSSDVIHKNGNPPTSVNWRVRQEAGKMAIVDVSIEGVSQSVTQRQEYASILQRNNGNIDALLDAMEQRLKESSDAQAQN